MELILNYIPKHLNSIFVSGKWKNINSARKTFSVENPSNKEKICNISFANRDDCDQAILSAKDAFNSFSETTINERIDFLKDIKQKFLERSKKIIFKNIRHYYYFCIPTFSFD